MIAECCQPLDTYLCLWSAGFVLLQDLIIKPYDLESKHEHYFVCRVERSSLQTTLVSKNLGVVLISRDLSDI